MITLYTETPEETIKSLKSYFLIDNHVELVLNIDEIDSNVEKWCENYCGELVEDKILFKLPFLFVSSSTDIINIINSNFYTTFLNEIRNIPMHRDQSHNHAGSLRARYGRFPQRWCQCRSSHA